jgi:hypothetical protein
MVLKGFLRKNGFIAKKRVAAAKRLTSSMYQHMMEYKFYI